MRKKLHLSAFLTSARLATISGTPTLFLWEPSPGDAGTGLDPAWPAGGYTPGWSEKLGGVYRNSPRGSREKSGKVELIARK